MNKKTAFAGLLIFFLIGMMFSTFNGMSSIAKADTQGDSNGSSSDIVVDNVTCSQIFVDQGMQANLQAGVENLGSLPANFNLTFYGNGVPLNTQPVALAGSSSSLVSFLWNTTDFALGNYTLSASAWSVTGEANVAYSNCTGSTLLVSCAGDMIGHCAVDFSDLTCFVSAYINYTETGGSSYYPIADLNHDGKIDFLDLQLFVADYISFYSNPTPFGHCGLAVTTTFEQTTYTQGEPVNFTINIINLTDKTITFTYMPSTFDFIVYNATGIIYRYSFERAYPMWAEIYSLTPGATLSNEFEWDQTSNQYYSPVASPLAPSASCPEFPVSPGTYYIVGEALGMQTVPQQITITSG